MTKDSAFEGSQGVLRLGITQSNNFDAKFLKFDEFKMGAMLTDLQLNCILWGCII